MSGHVKQRSVPYQLLVADQKGAAALPCPFKVDYNARFAQPVGG